MWRRIRSHISPKDEKSEYLSVSDSQSRRPSSTSVAESERGRSSPVTDSQDVTPPARGPSPFSSYRERSPGSEQRAVEELGLHMLYDPSTPALMDIVFVHGLGGASRRTWSKYQNPDLFWPQQWLPLEPDVCNARIFTFGYNANFRSSGPMNTNIADFAKDLLFEMRFGRDGNGEDFNFGRVPTIFVVHSMGGLVVKKTCLLGQNDDTYQEMVKSISAIVFLSTPHRGTNLAELLNRLMQVSFQSSKDFVMELRRSSPALEEINEQFRHFAPKLTIFSFHETLPTSVGLKKLMVLEKESSILGYSNEISRSLNADHHDVCKFISPFDPNYINVRNAITSLVKELGSKELDAAMERASLDMRFTNRLFANADDSEDELDNLRQRRIPGTCEWILSERYFQSWLKTGSYPHIIWMNAPPGAGKSVTSAFVTDHLRQSGQLCQYFLFKHGEHNKSALSTMFKSLALQVARDVPAFRRELVDLPEASILDRKDARFVWQRIFMALLSHVPSTKPLFWIIDGLDECDSPKIFLDLLRGLPEFRTPIRIFITSRKTDSLSYAFTRASNLQVDTMEASIQDSTATDIKLIVENELREMRGSNELKLEVVEKILHRADGNILWVRLVLEEILCCHTPQAIQQTLEELPAGMEALYQRMEQSLSQRLKKGDWLLARKLLSWVVCAYRPFSLSELSEALKSKGLEFLDLEATLHDVCGQFVVVDRGSRVSLIHKTAREFLTQILGLQLHVDEGESHVELFSMSISFLLHNGLRSRIGPDRDTALSSEPLLLYASSSCMYHLRQGATSSDEIMDKAIRFFQGRAVLTWIHVLSLFGRIDALVTAARTLTWFVEMNKKLNAQKNPLLHRLQDLELLETWSVDLVKLVAKFGQHLLDDPTSIYKIIPALCPKASVLFQQMSPLEDQALSVSGISEASWNDCLARLNLTHSAQALKILCAGHCVAVLTSTKSIEVWDSSDFQKACSLKHGEYIQQMCFNSKCDRLVSYGFKTTKIWSVPAGDTLATVPNPARTKALAIAFAEHDTIIRVASQDKNIRVLHVTDTEKGWQTPYTKLLQEDSPVEGGIITSPSFMAFNSDASRVAVAYRGYPLSVWSTKSRHLIARCQRLSRHRPDSARPSVSWMAVDRVAWNPIVDNLIGLYKDGSVFKWDPVRDQTKEASTLADEIEISPDGKLFLTSDSNGTIKIWNLTYFSVIYQLCSGDLVADMAFSSDCTRFYDLRGSSINVWEPNSLVRFSDHAETISDTTSEHQMSTFNTGISEASISTTDPVTAFATSDDGSVYCAAHGSGTLEIFDGAQGKLHESKSLSQLFSIDHLTITQDCRHVIGADLGGSILGLRVERVPRNMATGFELHPLPIIKAKIETGGIQQLLTDRSSAKVMVITQDLGQVWSIQDAERLVYETLPKAQTRKWINHPWDPELLLAFGSTDVHIISWRNLKEVARMLYPNAFDLAADRLSLDDPQLPSVAQPRDAVPKTDDHVHKAILTQDGKHFVVEILCNHARKARNRLLTFKSSWLQPSASTEAPAAIPSLDISPDLMPRIEVQLGILPGDKLVFLDTSLWMCTIRLDSLMQVNAVRRHYFIPRDWASSTSLEQCRVLPDGTLLFPKEGDIVKITSRIAEDPW